MPTTSVSEVLVKSAHSALEKQDWASGAMPAGHNGPYHDPETPVRNTAHWLITFLHVYQLAGQRKFFQAAEKALGYLMSKDARPGKATFWHRTETSKDSCNGLIGQAWTMEALVFAGKHLGRGDALSLAREVFFVHPFGKQRALWHRVEPDGSVLSVDRTFNHQLWFCAMASFLSSVNSNDTIDLRVKCFLDRIWQNLSLRSSGLIVHSLRDTRLRSRLRRFLKSARWPQLRRQVYLKEIGYHAFNTYAFAILHQCLPTHPLWRSVRFASLIRFLDGDEYAADIKRSPYGFPYNPPGSEVAFTAQVFNRFFGRTVIGKQVSTNLLAKQFRLGYDFTCHRVNRNTTDSGTATARLYELVRLEEELSGQVFDV